MEENKVLLTTKGYRVMDSMGLALKYGVTVYQVWQTGAKDTPVPGQYRVEQTLLYETSSKAKANAVCEYLNLKVEQDDLDGYRSEDTKGTIKPSSIKV